MTLLIVEVGLLISKTFCLVYVLHISKDLLTYSATVVDVNMIIVERLCGADRSCALLKCPSLVDIHSFSMGLIPCWLSYDSDLSMSQGSSIAMATWWEGRRQVKVDIKVIEIDDG